MKSPDPYDITSLQRFLANDAMGSDCMRDLDQHVWGRAHLSDSHHQELIGLKPREGSDTFSRFLVSEAINVKVFLTCWGCKLFREPNPNTGGISVQDNIAFKGTFWFTSLTASIVPLASIIVLLYMSSLAARLWTIGAFNILISVCLFVFTDARRVDVFAVTAA